MSHESKSESEMGGRSGITGHGLTGHDLTVQYRNATSPALESVSVDLVPGRLLALLGPNGSGKSTLLRALSGELRLTAGSARLDGTSVHEMPDRPRALAVGVVTQSEPNPFPVSVEELVGMGRFPHVGPWAPLGAEDHRAVDEAMKQCGVDHLATRRLRTLSGGERQRARVARALAQQPRYLLLDEPTTGLDLHYQMELLVLLRQLTEQGIGILIVTHDINLAARFADEMMLLSKGRCVARGTPEKVMRADLLGDVYGWPFLITSHPGPGPDTGVPQALPLTPS